MEKTAEMIRKAAKRGAQVVCLQELYRTGYFPIDENREVGDLAETIPGKSTSLMSRLAKELSIVIIVPIFELDSSGKCYNTAVVIDADGEILGSYRKIHIPYDPLFYEKSYFEVGNLGYKVFKSRYLTFGVLICYDQWYPEAARICALHGADVIFYPSAIGYPGKDSLPRSEWHSAWETIQRAHAIANSVHVASVNRVGKEGEIKFWGSSFVCDAFGRVLKRASSENEEVLVVKIDISQNKRISEGWGFAKNRRPETYGSIASQSLQGTPRELGYRMPAEWERHSATWLAWPHDEISFPRLGKVEESYIRIIKGLEGETVNLFVKDSSMEARLKEMLKKNSVDMKKVNFYVWDYADVWFRDYGPIFLVDGNRLAMLHWTFNAWGEKYRELMKDSQIPYIISQKMQLNYFRPEIVLEGGSIDVNGKGTLMTTEQCLLNKNRNPRLSKVEIEKYLRDYLGVSHFIWLKSGIEGDDTDGHIDDVARFVAPRTVLCAYEENEKDKNYRALKSNYDALLEAVDQDGNSLNVIKIPMPSPIHATVCRKKTVLPASYVNFYIANKAVLVPIFQDKRDSEALSIVQKLFPGRKVVGIDCRDLLYGLGAIHCVTQQQPEI
jgi:agmatine deiminase